MPCFATGSAEGDALLSAAESDREATAATRAACEMLRELRSFRPSINNLSKSTMDWIKRHEEIDRKRKKKEREEMIDKVQRNKALKKLTKKERDLLGV